MRRFISILLAGLMLICCGCNSDTPTLPKSAPVWDLTRYKVTDPLPYPDYTFDHAPTTEELRQTAVRAMRDLLSIRWSTAKGISYRKTGPVSKKHFQHQPDTTYAGSLYSNASTGLFQFLEFYDHNTGRLYFPKEYGSIEKSIGNSCADSLIWGWNTVCTSITGNYYPSTMVYKNGYYPVGDYTYDFSITSYNIMPTYTIIKNNGKDVIFDAYCLVQPGDALVSTSDDHGMMAIEPACICYDKNGKLDTKASYVMIQDQRGGRGAGFYESQENGETILYSGRTSAKFTFDELLEKNYIPVAPAEFLETKEYEAATVTASQKKCKTLDDLRSIQVESNYPLAVINVIVEDQAGNQAVIGRELFSGAHKGGVPKTYALKDMDCLKDFENSKYNRETFIIKIEVVPSTGERFIAAQLKL